MLDATTLAAFAGASLMLLVIPGPTMMYIVARGAHQGRAAALVSALGVEVGTLIQLLAATFGLAALVSSSERAATALELLGAAYLVWLALVTLLERPAPRGDDAGKPASLRTVFLQGVLVEALNPKTALFFLAFLPQFTDPAGGSVHWQLLALGLIFLLMALCADGLVALLAGNLGERLGGNARFLELRGGVSAGVYLSLATLALPAPGL